MLLDLLGGNIKSFDVQQQRAAAKLEQLRASQRNHPAPTCNNTTIHNVLVLEACTQNMLSFMFARRMNDVSIDGTFGVCSCMIVIVLFQLRQVSIDKAVLALPSGGHDALV